MSRIATPEPPPKYTVEEYLAIDEASDRKHEYWFGEIVAMPGGTYEHSSITANVIRELGNATSTGPCVVHSPDLRVKPARSALYFYPDASVVCDEPDFEYAANGRPIAVRNPKVIVEVLSPSTEWADMVDKQYHYLQIDSVAHYLRIEQYRPRIEVLTRNGDGSWRLSFADGMEGVLDLPAVNARIPLAGIYAKVNFRPRPTPPKPTLLD
jgi:Uma2 family endonuclease